VVRRKLLPMQKRRFHSVESHGTGKLELRRRHVAFLARRVVHHARTLLPAASDGVMWWLRSRGLGSAFLRFLGAAALFNFGMTVFFMLYNLHLLKRGFHEDFLGPVATAVTIGSIAGTIPAGMFTTRFGLRPALFISF